MSIIRHVVLTALVLPGAVFASNVFNVASSSCSGSLVSTATHGLSYACTGDFILSNGAIFSDTSILLSATGSLQLTDISLTAPAIFLNAGRQLAIDSTSTLQAPGIRPLIPSALPNLLAGGQIEIRQNSVRNDIKWDDLNIGTSGAVHFIYSDNSVQLGNVPEPESLALVLAGLAAVGLALRKDLIDPLPSAFNRA